MNLLKKSWDTDITKVRTRIIANLEQLKNKYAIAEFLASILGKNMEEKEKKELTEKIASKIKGIQVDSFDEIMLLIKDKIRNVNFFLALLTETFYATEDKPGETERLADILQTRLIARGMASDRSNINTIDTTWLTEDEPQESIYYDYIFALTLRQTALQEINNFLSYRNKKYTGNFKNFLEVCLKEYELLFNPQTIEISLKWLNTPTVSNNNSEKKEIESEKQITISLPRIKRDKNDNATDLTADQSAYLMLFLKEVKIILKDNTYQTNLEMAKALQVMTGYKAGQARKVMSTPIEKIDKKELKALKAIVEKLLASINRHI